MSTDSSPTPRSIIDVLGSPQGRDEWATFLFYWSGTLFVAGVGIICWFVVGVAHPAFALLVTVWGFCLTPGVAIPAVRVVTRLSPPQAFRVPASERVLHRALGVGVFAWLLERSGYNRHVLGPLRKFSGSRSGLRALEQSARGGEIAHSVVFAIHLLLAIAALFSGYPWGALWILLPGVLLHLYPVLLQRSIILRLQPLLDKPGAKLASGLEQPG